MLVGRLDLGMLALGVSGIVWLSAPPREAEPRGNHVAQAPPIDVMCSTNGRAPEAMEGPFFDLGGAVGGQLDVKAMVGVAPFQQVTVVHFGDGAPDLMKHDRLVLAVQVGGSWFTRDLATIGPFCGDMGSPTWVDAEADAPRIAGGAVSVRVHETYRQGESERASDSLVECHLEP